MPRPHLDPRVVDRAVLILILLAAILLRAEYLLQIEHNVDHAWPIAQALDTLDRGIWPLTGQGTSVLFASGPLTGYLYLPVVALTRSPLGVYVFVIALNTLGVLLAYRAAQTLLGPRRALIAAGLLAVNPWVIEYSRTTWVQSLLPFFVPAVAWLLWPVLLGRSRRPVRRTALALIVLTMAAQTYLLAYALLVPVVILLVIFRRRLPRRGLLIGGAVFLLATAIYGLGLAGQWPTVQERLAAFASNQAALRPEAWDHAVRLISGADYALARGIAAPAADSALRHDLSRIAHGAILAALLIGIVLAGWEVVRGWASRIGGGAPGDSPIDHQRRESALIALAWFLLPVGMMIFVGQVVHPFDQLIGLPAGHVLAAWGLGAVFRPERRAGGLILAGLMLPFAVLMGLNSARYYQETAALPGAHDVSALPLEYGLRLGAAVREAMPEDPADGLAFIDLEGWVLNSLAGEWFPTQREVRAPLFSIIPAGGGAYVAAVPPGAEVPGPPLGAERAALFDLPDGWTITVEAYPPGAAATCAPEAAGPPPGDGEHGARVEVPSEQGITLHSYALEKDGDGGWRLTTLWRVAFRAEIINQRLFGAFAHVFAADGERVLIVDGAEVPGHEWRVGDCHVHQMTFRLPDDAPGPFTVKVGQYDALHQENVIFRRPPDSPDGDYSPLVTLEPALERPARD